MKLGLIAAMALAAPVAQQLPVEPAGADQRDQLGLGEDRAGRMTVPVSINGAGPYRFVVDTGAERTVISQELARSLRLQEGSGVQLHSMSGVSSVDTVMIPRLGVSRRTVKDIDAPALAKTDLGADGMLGVDSLQSQRVLFDFEKQLMSVTPSRRPAEATMEPDTIVVKARNRFGRLVLADARVDGIKIWAIIDTGTQVTIGNEALRRRLQEKGRLGATAPVEVISVTGEAVPAEYTQVKMLKIGGVKVVDLPVAFADAHPFRKLDLVDRPALLLGMDALALFDRVSVDFAARKVQFDMPDLSGRPSEARMASLERPQPLRN